MNNLNFCVKDFKVLREISSYSEFYNKAMNIKRIFNFKGKVIIDVVDTLNELSKILNMDVPNWVIGTSFDNVILIINHDNWENNLSEKVEDLILHEFIHVVLNQKSNIPIWLNEGLAVYFSNQYHISNYTKTQISEYFDFYKLDYSSNNLYYISAYIIAKLINEYGEKEVIEQVLNTKNFEKNKIFNNCNLLKLIEDN